MAYYGIPSVNAALTAATANDVIGMLGVGGTTLSGQSIFGADGNDVINFGALGANVLASITGTRVSAGQRASAANVVGSGGFRIVPVFNGVTGTIFEVTSGQKLGAASGVQYTQLVTSTLASTQIGSISVDGGAGHDSIIFDRLRTGALSASTLEGGAGNDFIGFGSDLNGDGAGVITTGRSVGLTNSAVVINAGDGRDTIGFEGVVTFDDSTIRAQKENDTLIFSGTTFNKTFLGLGAGNDSLNAGGINDFDGSTLIGGKGNDTIGLQLGGSTITGFSILGDASAVSNSDGHDAINISGGTLGNSSVFGGGGNDVITFSGGTLSQSAVVNMNVGNDTINVLGGTTIFGSASSNFGMGKNRDVFNVASGGSFSGSTINMGKGFDTVTHAVWNP